MVILEIDGQKYGGQSYIDGLETETDREESILKLAREVAETVFIHYGYGIDEIELNATLTSPLTLEGEAE